MPFVPLSSPPVFLPRNTFVGGGWVASQPRNDVSVKSWSKWFYEGKDGALSILHTATPPLRPTLAILLGSASIRWDEEGLQHIKEQRRKERCEKVEKDRREGKESRAGMEGSDEQGVGISVKGPRGTDPYPYPKGIRIFFLLFKVYF
ncbi:hypothetical protein BDQ17DRAFT_1336617 [Cyathus striatus]|nr:hypothetical protein BDQ17DRAFT_1336617 [Cyathus striatus]